MSYFNENVTNAIGEALRATLIFSIGLSLAIAYGFIMYTLGSRTASTEIYQQQNNDLRILVGIIDQAKGREVASCAASGRSDCLATLGETP